MLQGSSRAVQLHDVLPRSLGGPCLHILRIHGLGRQLLDALSPHIHRLDLRGVVCRDGGGHPGATNGVGGAVPQGAENVGVRHPTQKPLQTHQLGIILCHATLGCSVPTPITHMHTHTRTRLQQRRQQVEVPLPGGQVGGGVAPGVAQPRVSAAPQQQLDGGQVAVPAGLWSVGVRGQVGGRGRWGRGLMGVAGMAPSQQQILSMHAWPC